MMKGKKMDEQDTGFIFMLMTVWDIIWSVCLQRKGFGNGRLLLQFFKYEGEITASEAAVSSEMSTGKLVRVPDISSHEIIVKQSVNSDKPSGKNMFSMMVLEKLWLYSFIHLPQLCRAKSEIACRVQPLACCSVIANTPTRLKNLSVRHIFLKE